MANENKYTPEGTGPDDTVVQGDDLKSSAKDTLGSYLSGLTTDSASQNAFPIEDISRVESHLQGSAGLPADFQTGGGDANPGFTRNMSPGNAAVSHFDTLSDSGKIETLSDVLNKNSQTDGHTLLSNVVSNRDPGEPGVGDSSGASAIPSPTDETDVQRKISNMLKSSNRFDPNPSSSPYIYDGAFTEPGIPIEQGEFGIYNDDAVRTTLEDLHKIAHSMMVRATGHKLGASQDPDAGSTAPTTNVQKGSKKVSTFKTSAAGAYKAPERASLVDAELRYDDITGDPLEVQKSFGQLSSYREKFETARISNLNTAVGALTEYLAVAAAFGAIIQLVELLEMTAPTHTPSAPHKLRKGQWHKEPSILRMFRQLGIPNLDRPVWLCAVYGLAAFFKIPPSVLPPVGSPSAAPLTFAAIGGWFATVAASAPDTMMNVLYGSGYYANTMRVVRRDMERLLDEVTFSTSGTSGPDAAIAIFKVMTNLQSYSSWNFFVSVLRMGDAYLSSYQKYVRFNHMKMSGQTRQQHSRVKGSNKLSWRHRSAPALVLLNKKYRDGAKVYGFNTHFHERIHNQLGDGKARTNDSPYWGNLRNGGKNRGLKDNEMKNFGRYSREDVVQVENELDSEYCPFYFHDLRTNEVIGFQAFLSDVKDSYSVSYAESGGYGRIDKVKIYQDTTRSISLSFTMVATSPKDFDSMWWSFNKLISMIYPQFSMGKPVQAGSKKFIMPFSQIPTASPVIRLRVGDLIRSNYSRFNLARLFGLSEVKPAPVSGVSATSTAGSAIAAAPFDLSATEAIDSAGAAEAAEEASLEASVTEMIETRFNTEPSFYGDPNHGYVPGDPYWGKAILSPSTAGYPTWDTAAGAIIPITAGTATPAGVVNKHSANPPGAGATHVEATPFPSRPSTSGEVTVLERIVESDTDGDGIANAEYYVQYTDPNSIADPYRQALADKGHYHTYLVTNADLTPIRPVLTTSGTYDATVSLADQITDVTNFFDPANNAIVRSFEAAGGRGLAGVITSLDFDWGDAQWDMNGIGRRAPTLLNVNISFSPIHDIIPGLDNNGMMRAINYPVGEIAGPLGTDSVDPGAVNNSAFAMRSSVPGATYPGDASAANYSGFADSQDEDGEGD